MPIVTSEKPKFDPTPAGIHQAVFQSIVDLGTHVPDNPKYAKSRKIYITWELVHETYQDKEGNTRRRKIGKEYSLSFGKKANLRAMLNSCRGRDLSEEELKSFNTDSLLGLNCQLNVVHRPKVKDPSSVYAAVQTVVPLSKGVPLVKTEDPVVSWDIPASGPIVPPPNLPEWLQEKIKESEEYKARHGANLTTTGLGGDNGNPY